MRSLDSYFPPESHTVGAVPSGCQRSYVAMLAPVVLDERSRGESLNDIERRWGLSGLDGIEESWRDTVLWLLSGHTALFEVRGFYHHLRETCSATAAQIYTTKHPLSTMRRQVYDLLKKLKYCSPLGSLVHGIRGSLPAGQEPTVGVGTIRKLEAAGVVTLQQVGRHGR